MIPIKFFLIKQVLGKDIAQEIFKIYDSFPTNWGQLYFQCSCGMMSRLETNVNCSYSYALHGYIGEISTIARYPLKKISEKICGYYECEKCKELYIDSVEGTIQTKIQCYCTKIGNLFPCGTCWAKRCAIEGCTVVVDTSISILCDGHRKK